MEWTPARIRLFREVGRCESQHDFAKTLGVAERTISNAERGTHQPSLALRRALDQALEHATDAQRDRFLATVAARNSPSFPDTPSGAAIAPGARHVLDGLRSAVLGTPLLAGTAGGERLGESSAGTEVATAMAVTVRAHSLYQMADYDAAAELLAAVLTRLQSSGNTDNGHDKYPIGTLTARHAKAVTYLAVAKLATKLGDVGLASVTADRAMAAAKESDHPALIGVATYQVACALLLAGELNDAERILTAGAENVASVTAARRLNCCQEEAISVRGSLLLLLAITAARRADRHAAQKALHDADQLAQQLGCDSNWLWTAFGSTNVAIHQLSVQSALGDVKMALQLGAAINTDSLPAVLLGRRSQVHLELGWAAAGQGDDAVAVLHLLEAERVAKQAVSRNKSATTLLSTLLARERKSVTPGLRGLAARAGLLP